MLSALSLKIELLDRKLIDAGQEASRLEMLLQEVIRRQARIEKDIEQERSAARSHEHDLSIDVELHERYFIAQEKKLAELSLSNARLHEDVLAVRERMNIIFSEKEQFRLLKEQEEERIAREEIRKEHAERDEHIISREWRKQRVFHHQAEATSSDGTD